MKRPLLAAALCLAGCSSAGGAPSVDLGSLVAKILHVTQGICRVVDALPAPDGGAGPASSGGAATPGAGP